MRFLDKLFPTDEDPAVSPAQREIKADERKHFIFASVLILGAMLLLPIGGAIYVLLIKFGVVAQPY